MTNEDRWEANKALEDLLRYMDENGLKRWYPNTPGTYTFFPDGSALAIEIRLGLPV